MNYLNKPGSSDSAESLSLVRFMKRSDASPLFVATKAKSVVLAVQPSKRAIFEFDYATSFLLQTTDFNYWNSYDSAAALNKPTNMWSSGEKNKFSATMHFKPGYDALNSIIGSDSSFSSGFNPAQARVI